MYEQRMENKNRNACESSEKQTTENHINSKEKNTSENENTFSDKYLRDKHVTYGNYLSNIVRSILPVQPKLADCIFQVSLHLGGTPPPDIW